MRTIKRTSQFKKDYKREMKGKNSVTLKSDLVQSLNIYWRTTRYFQLAMWIML